MKNRLITLTAALGLMAVLGKYCALPVLAQTKRAVLVASADEEGRVPYRAVVILDCLGGVDCTGQFPGFPIYFPTSFQGHTVDA
jgi:hypothetical protein